MGAHVVSIAIGSKTIEKWQDYAIEIDMLSIADSFQLGIGGRGRDVWELVKPDEDVTVLIDGNVVLTGFIDDRKYRVTREGTRIDIRGRDRGGRLVDESMPLLTFEGLAILQLAQKAVGPWFPNVVLSNAKNRKILRGKKARKARVTREPTITSEGRTAKKVDPGETRARTLEKYLQEGELLAWSSADGQEFVIGLPNYDQEAQYRFFHPRQGSTRRLEGNVEELEIEDTVGERYSMITAVGAGRGNTKDYGDAVTKRKASVYNNPLNTVDGTGKDFKHPKRLIVAHDDVKSLALAQKRARREMAERDGSGHHVTLTTPGHSQIYGGTDVLYAPDCMCELEEEETGVKGNYLITSVSFTNDRGTGEKTRMTLVPEGTVLRQ